MAGFKWVKQLRGVKGSVAIATIALVVMLAIATLVTMSFPVGAEDPIFGRPNTWTGEQSIRTNFVYKAASPSGRDGGTQRYEGFDVPYDSYNKRFSVKGTEGSVLLIDVTKCVTSNGVYPASYSGAKGLGTDTAGTGATVYLPTVTAALDGTVLTLVQKVSSTVTPFILYGTGINGGGSGSTTFTNSPYKILPMRAGDYITVRAAFKSAVSWYITDYNAVGVADVAEYTSGTTLTGFSPDLYKARIFYINPANTVALNTGNFSTLGAARIGTTVTLPTPTRELDGVSFKIVNWSSGTSEVVPYAGGLPMGNTSGTTPGAVTATLLLNGKGESVTLRAAYNSAVSYFVENYYIQ